MPFVSRSQVKKFGHLVKQNKMSKETFQHWLDATPNIKSLPEHVPMKKKAFVESFEKVAAAGPSKWYKPLEYGGLGVLTATDLYDAHKAQQEGKKGERNKALLNAGALGALMGATHLAGH